MGFRTGAYATVWEVRGISDTMTRCRVSISKKNRTTGQYEQDFGGYITFIGSAAANKALKLKEKDRIKLGDVDVDNKYVKEKDITYTNFKVFSFDGPDEIDSQPRQQSSDTQSAIDAFVDNVGDGDINDEFLPY